MNVLCQNCRTRFDVPIRSAGRIDYDGCKNVFRVNFRFRTPCPSCRKILQLSPAGNESAVGIVLEIPPNEKTESLELPRDATLPRAQARTQAAPLPTVRVTRVSPSPLSPAAATKVAPFRFADQNFKRQAPLHVSVAPRRRSLLPILKLLFGFLVASASTATIVLTLFALRTGSPRPEAPSPPSLTASKAPETVLPQEPQGGPREEFDPAAIERMPRIEIKPDAPAFRQESLALPGLHKLTSGYGVRLDPFDQSVTFHKGLDFKAEYRSEVKSALPGKVIRAGFIGSYGYIVIIEHPEGYESRYAHLDKILVKEGRRVKKGELVGLAGSSGRSTGTHIHFELLKDGKRVDPLRIKLLAKKT
jgi:murein DD-endopeptidase MepM/ murein hydrolase activator NlpD